MLWFAVPVIKCFFEVLTICLQLAVKKQSVDTGDTFITAVHDLGQCQQYGN